MIRCILLILFYFFAWVRVQAQQGVYIPRDADVYAHPADTISIFVNVSNHGSFGSADGATINFFGDHWSNASTALLPGAGGLFRFRGTQKQSLAAGYFFNGRTGPSFPNLSIENQSGVWLDDLNDLHIRGSLFFNQGYLYLNGWNALVDSAIKGYSADGFVVTGKDIAGGYLYRKPPDSDSMMVFPVGTDPGSYTPLALQNGRRSGGAAAGISVFDQVYANATNGNAVDHNFVQKTWQLKTSGDALPDTLLLQHGLQDEDASFTSFRDSSYITRYDLGMLAWDTAPPGHTVHAPGFLTTGKPQSNSYVNDRVFPEGLDSVSWLSVSTNPKGDFSCPVADFQLWVAQRYSFRWVQLFWRTLRERNVEKYELQRRRDTAVDFTTITTVTSKGVNGISNQLQYYYYADDNVYDGWTYYRLKLISPSGCFVYTSIQAVPWGIGAEVWPNPAWGDVHVRITGITHAIRMQVVNTWGQILHQYSVDQSLTIDLKDLPDAVYFVVFRDPKMNYQVIKTVKLIIQHGP